VKAILDRMQREPALVVGLVGAVIALLLAFGLDLSVDQQGAIMAAVVAVLAVVTRQSVTPNVSVAAKVDAAGAVVTGQATPPAGDPAAVVVDPANVVIVTDKPLPPDGPQGYGSGV
jgi:predicted cation transporter